MDMDLRIRKILQDYELNGDGTKAKNRMGGLMGFAILQNKKNKLSEFEVGKIQNAFKKLKAIRTITWKTRFD